MYITSIPPHTTLVAKIERLKCIIEDFKVSVIRYTKTVLKEKLNTRYIGEPGFVQGNLIFSKLDELITHNKVTTNQSTGEREERFLHLVEYVVSSEGEILILTKEKRGNDYCIEIGEAQNPFISAMTQASIILYIMTQHLKKQKLSVGLP